MKNGFDGMIETEEECLEKECSWSEKVALSQKVTEENGYEVG